MVRVKLVNRDNLRKATAWCFDRFGCHPQFDEPWCREFKSSDPVYDLINRSTIFFVFVDDKIALEFKLMGF